MESFESEGSTFHFVAGGPGKKPEGATPELSKKRPPYRPPVGVPLAKHRELGGKVAAFAFHALLLLLLLAPLTSPELRKEVFGAGGAGPAGGGGGGNRGTGGGRAERTQYVRVTPPPPKPSIVPQIQPPVIKPPVVPPPVVPPPPTPTPPTPTVTPPVSAVSDKPPANAASVTAGTGGGRGTDGSAGNGTGSGGGVGSGVGTGRGSGTGPGTGGGAGTIYPPTPTELFIPPMPPPSRIKGFELIAQFDVDSTGKVVDFEFTRTKDSGYNKKLEEILRSVRFRPGVNGLGVPVRAKTQIVYTF